MVIMGLETDMHLGVGVGGAQVFHENNTIMNKASYLCFFVVCQFSSSSYLQYGYSTFTVVFLAVTSDILAHVYNNHT